MHKRIVGTLRVLLLLAGLCGCGKGGETPPAAAAPEVSVLRATSAPVTLYADYAAQTQAVETVEIRARVGGILERQAFVDGAPVRRGQLLFVIDPRQYRAALNQAMATLAQARAAHVNSAQNLQRLQPLLADQAISQQDLDAAVARERSDAAAIEAGLAQVRQVQLNLDYTSVRSPRDGMASKALIRPGGLVDASTTLLTTVYSVDPMYAGFTISEQQLASLAQQYELRPASSKAPPFRLKLADGSDYPYPARLNFIDAAVNPRNGTIEVRVVVPNPDGLLRAGQFVRVIAPAGVRPNAILLPQQAVQELQGKHFIYVVGPDNKTQYREIGASTRIGNNWLVEQGLRSGELVAVEGIGKLKAGMAVKPVVAGKAAQVRLPLAPPQLVLPPLVPHLVRSRVSLQQAP